MLDIHLIRKDPKAVEAKLRLKEPSVDLTVLCELDQNRRELQTKVQTLRAQRNESSQRIGEFKRAGKDVEAIMREVSNYADEIRN